AEHGGAGERRVDGEVVDARQDLRRQFTRRCEHQRARRAARAIEEFLKDREDEGGGLSAARHRAREYVTPLERRRNRVRLDRSGAGVAEFLEGFVEAGVEREGAERHEGWI